MPPPWAPTDIAALAATMETNPFSLPTDEEVFRMRESERQRKDDERRRNASLKIYDKTTTSSTIGNIRRLRSEDPVRRRPVSLRRHTDVSGSLTVRLFVLV
jgi:hypothetical protein